MFYIPQHLPFYWIFSMTIPNTVNKHYTDLAFPKKKSVDVLEMTGIELIFYLFKIYACKISLLN